MIKETKTPAEIKQIKGTMTYPEFAKILGISVSHAKHIANGRFPARGPTLQLLKCLDKWPFLKECLRDQC